MTGVPKKVVCFFEDVAQENFIRTLVHRVANDAGVSVQIDTRNATHGSRVWKELKIFLRDLKHGNEPLPDVLIVVIDSNCKQEHRVRERIKNMVAQSQLLPLDDVVCAVPDPHIERWYLEDQHALSEAIPRSQARRLRYKCKRDHYKKALIEAIRAAGSEPMLGGAEYGEDIANLIDHQRLDRSFKNFWEELNRAIRRLVEVRSEGDGSTDSD